MLWLVVVAQKADWLATLMPQQLIGWPHSCPKSWLASHTDVPTQQLIGRPPNSLIDCCPPLPSYLILRGGYAIFKWEEAIFKCGETIFEWIPRQWRGEVYCYSPCCTVGTQLRRFRLGPWLGRVSNVKSVLVASLLLCVCERYKKKHKRYEKVISKTIYEVWKFGTVWVYPLWHNQLLFFFVRIIP